MIYIFGNKKRNMAQNMPYPNYYKNYNEYSVPNSYDITVLQTEINELKRTNTELLNRINRLESYLEIKGELNSSLF